VSVCVALRICVCVHRYRLRHLLVFYRISKFFSQIAIFDEFQSSLTNEPAKIKLLRRIDPPTMPFQHTKPARPKFNAQDAATPHPNNSIPTSKKCPKRSKKCPCKVKSEGCKTKSKSMQDGATAHLNNAHKTCTGLCQKMCEK
jgi:hypothetical protein